MTYQEKINYIRDNCPGNFEFRQGEKIINKNKFCNYYSDAIMSSVGQFKTECENLINMVFNELKNTC